MPNKVTILGIPYEIEYVEDPFDDGTGGQIDVMHGVIKIEKNYSEASQRRSLIHEIVHGIFSAIGYMDLYQDEKLVSAMSIAIDGIFDLKEEK